MTQTNILDSNHPLALLRRGAQRAATVMKETPVEEADSSREINRRGLLKTGVGLVAFSVLEPLFKIAEANDKVPGDHHFTPQNIAKLKIDTTEELLNLARKQGYLPTETANSEFSYSKFEKIADRASLTDLRQYFRAIEMLRNDGYFDSNRKMEEVHEILSSTPDIAPVRELLLINLGARSKDGSQVIHSMTRDEFFDMLQNYLNDNYKFPYADDGVAKEMVNSFRKATGDMMRTSLNRRGVSKEYDAILKSLQRETAQK
jgi:hypothetical protein